MPPHEWPVCDGQWPGGLFRCRGQLLSSLGLSSLVSRAVVQEQPFSGVGGQCQLSEHVNRIWVSSWEPRPGLDFLSLTSSGLLIRVCSSSHLVLDLAERRGPGTESEPVDWEEWAACLCLLRGHREGCPGGVRCGARSRTRIPGDMRAAGGMRVCSADLGICDVGISDENSPDQC